MIVLPTLLSPNRFGAITVLALAAALAASAVADGPQPAARRQSSEPFLVVTQLGADGEGAPWDLAVGKDRTARLTIKGVEHKIALTEAVVANLLSILKAERFAQLEGSYGTVAIDRDYRVIDAWVDGRKKSVNLYSDLDQDPRHDQVARALRVWLAARDLFDIPGAIDTRPQDRALAERKESTPPQ